MNPQIREAAEEAIVKAIRGHYSEDFFPPIRREQKAKDAVAADLLRAMAPALASQALDAIEPLLASHIALAERRGGERVVRAVEEAHLTDDTIRYLPKAMGKNTIKTMLNRQLEAARAALKEVEEETFARAEKAIQACDPMARGESLIFQTLLDALREEAAKK